MEENMLTTTDHAQIRTWVQYFQGHPTVLHDPEAGSQPPALRLDFPGKTDDAFLGSSRPESPLSWEDFFDLFDQLDLAFMYLPPPKVADPSYAYRFVPREVVSLAD